MTEEEEGESSCSTRETPLEVRLQIVFIFYLLIKKYQ